MKLQERFDQLRIPASFQQTLELPDHLSYKVK
jgi:hypothetical protein